MKRNRNKMHQVLVDTGVDSGDTDETRSTASSTYEHGQAGRRFGAFRRISLIQIPRKGGQSISVPE